MSELTETPEWVWNLLDALSEYENVHSPLYRYTGEGKDGYERAECFGAFLSAREAWPPREMQDAAEFRRHVIRENTPNPPTPESTPAGVRDHHPHRPAREWAGWRGMGDPRPLTSAYDDMLRLVAVQVLADEMQCAHPDWRRGQALFNALHGTDPALADAIRGTEADPFHDDSRERVQAFAHAVMTLRLTTQSRTSESEGGSDA